MTATRELANSCACWEGSQPALTPLSAQQLLGLAGSVSAQPCRLQEMVCTGPTTSLSPCLEMPSWGKGTGDMCGHAEGQRLWGCHVRGSLGAKALHNPVPLHAIKKEEVVVRRVPLRQGLGRETRGFSSRASKGKKQRKKKENTPNQGFSKRCGQWFPKRWLLLPRGYLATFGDICVGHVCPC